MRTFDELVEAAGHFAEGFLAFEKLDVEARRNMREYVEALEAPDITEQERDSVHATIAQSLWSSEAWASEKPLESE